MHTDSMNEARKIVAECLCVDEDECTPDAYLVKDLEADSLSLLSVYLEVGERIGDKAGAQFENDHKPYKLTVRAIAEALHAHS